MSNTSQKLELSAIFDESLQDGTFVKLSLGDYQGSEENLKNIYVRKILVKREEKLSLTYHYKTRDIVKNYDTAQALKIIHNLLMDDFNVATLFTTKFDMVLEKKSLKERKPTHTETPSFEHDRSKKRQVATEGKAYLHALNITDAKGAVYKNAQDKYRQIDKFVEIMSGLIKDLPAKPTLKIADMGAGKGYLTFALYDYLTTQNIQAQVTGIEMRPDLVKAGNKIAQDSHFDGLSFIEGTIQNYDADDVDILIALHACDTATDDAIYKGIKAGADLIVVAPCCHKQIRREMEKGKPVNDLDFLTQYGIFLERHAEMVTDGLRGMLLEYAGYKVKIFEFISDAHTPKNILIVGVKNDKAKPDTQAIREKIKAKKSYFGIEQHHLETLLAL